VDGSCAEEKNFDEQQIRTYGMEVEKYGGREVRR
jgi:hypothetical protein